MRYLIFDSGPLINFSINGLLDILKKLKKEFRGDFLITKEVKQEIIDTPKEIKRFELEALRLEESLNSGLIKLADLSNEQIKELRKKRNEIMDLGNTTFRANGRYIHLIDKGEAAVLALGLILKIPYIVIDERTTRMLCEKPENLRKLLQKKLKVNIESKKSNYKFFKNFKIIRSTELIYIAHKRGLIEMKNPKAYEAMLYGLKFKGCSISEREIRLLKNL